MDIANNNSDTPDDGRPPIEAVAGTAVDGDNDAASGSTAGSARTQAGENDLNEKSTTPDEHGSSVPPKDENVAVKSVSAKQASKLDDLHNTTEFSGKLRQHWWQFNRYKNPPPPPPDNLDDAKLLPLGKVNFLNELLYIWIGPLIKLGTRRPLQVSQDMYCLLLAFTCVLIFVY